MRIVIVKLDKCIYRYMHMCTYMYVNTCEQTQECKHTHNFSIETIYLRQLLRQLHPFRKCGLHAPAQNTVPEYVPVLVILVNQRVYQCHVLIMWYNRWTRFQ